MQYLYNFFRYIYYKLFHQINLMDINKNIDLLNTFFIFKRFTKNQRIEAANIAKVSKNLEELKENLKWDYKYKNIK